MYGVPYDFPSALDLQTRSRVLGYYFQRPPTRRAAARARRRFNRMRREWMLDAGRESRRLLRLDPPRDYDDDMPF